jgi:hypothetical protein
MVAWIFAIAGGSYFKEKLAPVDYDYCSILVG